MSGPVTDADAVGASPPGPSPGGVEITESRTATVGDSTVRRALPRHGRRTVGAWCFIDHMGPAIAEGGIDTGIGPHPHMGLQTVTWLLSGELRHRDSLGSEQVIRPGQLNLMTAGRGVSHAEEGNNYRGPFEGVQLWVAQPDGTRHGAPAFEHHASLPQVEWANTVATVLVGAFGGLASPARRDTDHVGADLSLHGGLSVVPVERSAEHALVVLRGAVTLDAHALTPGHLAYVPPGRDELAMSTDAPARVLLVGGRPFESPVVMWWNFVGRSRDEMVEAQRQWNDTDVRFGAVHSSLARLPAPDIPWST